MTRSVMFVAAIVIACLVILPGCDSDNDDKEVAALQKELDELQQQIDFAKAKKARILSRTIVLSPAPAISIPIIHPTAPAIPVPVEPAPAAETAETTPKTAATAANINVNIYEPEKTIIVYSAPRYPAYQKSSGYSVASNNYGSDYGYSYGYSNGYYPYYSHRPYYGSHYYGGAFGRQYYGGCQRITRSTNISPKRTTPTYKPTYQSKRPMCPTHKGPTHTIHPTHPGHMPQIHPPTHTPHLTPIHPKTTTGGKYRK